MPRRTGGQENIKVKGLLGKRGKASEIFEGEDSSLKKTFDSLGKRGGKEKDIQMTKDGKYLSYKGKIYICEDEKFKELLQAKELLDNK